MTRQSKTVDFYDLEGRDIKVERLRLKTSLPREEVRAYLDWLLATSPDPKPAIGERLEVVELVARLSPKLPESVKLKLVSPDRAVCTFKLYGFFTFVSQFEFALEPSNRVRVRNLSVKALGIPYTWLVFGTLKSLLPRVNQRASKLEIEGRDLILDLNSSIPEEVSVQLNDLRTDGLAFVVAAV